MKEESIMAGTPSSEANIVAYQQKIKDLMKDLQSLSVNMAALEDPASLVQLENALQQKAKELSDNILGLKLQEHLDSQSSQSSSRELAEAMPKKMKYMGKRWVTIHTASGTLLRLVVDYYYSKARLRKGSSRHGIYPGLLCLGICDRYTPLLCDTVAMMAAATSSLTEAHQLLKLLTGAHVDRKTIHTICRRTALRARAGLESDQMVWSDDASGRVIAVSTDGGRIRIRKNKPGKKTAKKRTRYKTDWREPKLLIIYVVGEDGKKSPTFPPVIDASLAGPDALFGMLAYYLKKLQITLADQLFFIADGAPWIWDRVAGLLEDVGIDLAKYSQALDFYHAVEHLNELAKLKRWSARERQRWVNTQKRRLLQGQLDEFVAAIDTACRGTRNKLLKREKNYFHKHKDNMKYQQLKSQGLPIGSGAVESAIRRIINLRLKGPGIFWHEATADAMLMLRSYYKAGRWNLLKNMAYSGAAMGF
jgi:hypothetical protein